MYFPVGKLDGTLAQADMTVIKRLVLNTGMGALSTEAVVCGSVCSHPRMRNLSPKESPISQAARKRTDRKMNTLSSQDSSLEAV
jgi:hypothetical protein